MGTVWTFNSDSQKRITVESHLIYAIWSHPAAHAGQEAEVEVRTSFVGDGAKIRITCYTENGKKLDKIEGSVFNNRYKGRILIPEKARPDELIYFEAEQPKHRIKGESNLIVVRPAIEVSTIQWDRSEVKRKETAKLTCQFRSGVEDGDEAVVVIYEHNPNSCDIKVASIPTTIKDNRIEILWQFDYQDPISQIPTGAELRPYKKNYANPEFYFIVLVDGVRIGENRESGLMKFRDFLELMYLDEHGNPVPNVEYTVTYADDSIRRGRLDANGKGKEDGGPPGRAKVEYHIEE